VIRVTYYLIFLGLSQEMPCRDSQVGHQWDTFPGVKGGRTACVQLELRAWALKCIEKRWLYIRGVYLWHRSSRRKTRKETEGDDRYERGQRIRARSFNQPANHRTIRPTSSQQSKHLTLNSTNREEKRKRERERRE